MRLGLEALLAVEFVLVGFTAFFAIKRQSDWFLLSFVLFLASSGLVMRMIHRV
jgi:hypothetical protein